MSVSASVGNRLRVLREERRLTQRELARQAGLSSNAISLIERDEISPSVATLQQLAGALDVRMSAFFDLPVAADVIFLKAGQAPTITSNGVSIATLGARLNEQHVEPFLITLEAGSDAGDSRVVHTGHELVYCVEGQIEYQINDIAYLLGAGDLLMFQAELPHAWCNPAAQPARMLLVLQNSRSSADSIRRHFPSHPVLAHLPT